jgi:hypothetical protein
MTIRQRDQKKNGFATATMMCCLCILVLSAIIIAAPSLSFQSQTYNDGSKYSSGNGANDNNNANNNNLPIAIFPADSKPYGLTYGQWTAKWWQWGYSIPKDINPAYDDTGKNCAQKQNGPVWFLAGTYGHAVNRKCDIPAGKAILFPILNSECSFAEFPKLKTLSELRTCAKTIQDQVSSLKASVDGIPIPSLQEYRIQSPPFNFTLSQNNILGLAANVTTQAIADGNWVFLKPLSPGSHKITFRGGIQQEKANMLAAGSSNNASTTNSNSSSSSSFAFPTGWDFETTYDLTVNDNNATIIYSRYTSDSSSSNQNPVTTAAQHNVVKLLSDMVSNRLHDAVNLLEITSKDPIIQNVPFANFITKKYMGIPSNIDVQKRVIAQDILARDKDIRNIYFLIPNADVYFGEPFSYQQQLPKLNYADRDWYKGVTATNSTYISAIFMSASIHAPAIAIATPVYALQNNNDNTTSSKKTANNVISGYWVGIVDLPSIQESIKNLNLTNNERIVVVDHNGTAIINYSPSSPSATNNNNNNNNNNISPTKLENFGYLNSVKAVRNGNAGSAFETVNGTKILSIYQPIQLDNRFWGVVLIKSVI